MMHGQRRLMFLIMIMISFVSGFSVTILADDSQPLYVEINEVEPPQGLAVNHYQVVWRIASAAVEPELLFPKTCKALPQSIANPVSSLGKVSDTLSAKGKYSTFYQCQSTLGGQSLKLNRASYNSPAVLMKYHALNGEQHTRLLKSNDTDWQLPAAETPSRIAIDYTCLGIQHILIGTDHLLFLLCLLWIAKSFRRVLMTITGFTIAHSITLVLSSLEWVRLPIAPVEAVIALSIVFLACEIVKDNRSTLTWRHPVAVSSSFGLLHGFGFAAALAEIGLPQTALISGLLFFNLGVELGQIFFAGLVMLCIYAAKAFRLSGLGKSHTEKTMRYVTCYSVGGVASFWLIERTDILALFSAS